MKNKFFLIFCFVLIIILISGCMSKQINLSHKKAILIIAFKDFQDQEYQQTRQELESAGVKVKVASSSLGKANGKFGAQVNIDMLIKQVDINQFDTVVFIGGPGMSAYLRHPGALNLARSTVSQKKILAAICIAPEILANAGVLQGRQATVWSSPDYQQPIQVLRKGGARYLDQAVVIDGQIITANGPASAKDFGRAIVKQLSLTNTK